MKSPRFRALALIVAVLALLAGCSNDGKDVGEGASATSTPGGGAPPSAEAVAAAAARLADATSFRFEGSAQQSETGGQAIAQRVNVVFQAPDRLKVERLSLDGSLQLRQWYVGSQVYLQEPPQPDGTESPVRCTTSDEAPTSDPRRLLREVAKVDKITGVEQGAAKFDLPAEAAVVAFGPPTSGTYSEVSGRAAVTKGALSLLHVEAMLDTKKLQADFIYSEAGSAPPVEAPTADC